MKSKITILFISFFYCSQLVNAQITKGSILLGGQASFNHTNYKYVSNPGYEQSLNSGSISLSGGEAINDNSVIGLNLQLGSSNSYYNSLPTQKQKYYSYGAGIFYRKYKNLAKDFYFFLEGGVGYYHTKSSLTDSTGNDLQSSIEWTVGLNLAPGISYKVLKNLHLELSLPQMVSVGYTGYKGTQQGTIYRSNSLNFSSSLNSSPLSNLAVGFEFIF